MRKLAEFKVRIPNTKWENTPVVARLACDGTEGANERARRIAAAVEREVRWNWEGTVQGHYIGGAWRLRNRAMAEAEAIGAAGTRIFE